MNNREERIEQLFNKYGNKLRNIAFSYVKDQYLAEDIVQDVFLKCYSKLDTFRNECSIETWLYKITFNQSIDYLRKSNSKNSNLVESHDFLHSDLKTPELKLIEKQIKEELFKNIAILPKIYKEVVVLYYFKNLTLIEIHELLNENINTVKTRLHRGKMLLRNAYNTQM